MNGWNAKWCGALVMGAGLLGLTAAATPGQAQKTNFGVKMDVVPRVAKAINYRHRSGATKIDFAGTALLPQSRGEAKVESKRGYLEIEVEFQGLGPARQFGSEYFTYVLWAITAEGRPENLGEIVLNGDKAKLNVTTQLQAFALVVTAEPYFAVTYPSDVVVMENVVRKDTRGRVEEVEARYELLKRGQYVSAEQPDELTAKLMVVDPKVPLQLYQARNAVRIARWTGAEKLAPEAFGKAVEQLLEAERYQARKRPETKAAAMMARQAVQTAEDARLLAVKRGVDMRLAAERKAAEEREALAKAETETEAVARAKAEMSAQESEKARQMANQRRLEAEKAAAEALRTRQEAESQARAAEAQRMVALANLKRVQEDTQAQLAVLDASRSKALATADKETQLRAKAEMSVQQAEVELQRIRQETQAEVSKLDAARVEAMRQKTELEEAMRKAERERGELRDRLQVQLNKVLTTTNTARGLIVNLSDVLFDTAQYTLRGTAREKLARVSGILSMQPEMKLAVEGHTDSVGSDAYNQTLSERRAAAVESFLIEQGLEPGAITSVGFGETRPKASNDTAAARQENRRVEIVLSGSSIGTPANENR